MTENVPKTCKEITQDNLSAKYIIVSIMWSLFQMSQNKGQEGKKQRESKILHVARLMSLRLQFWD